MFNKEDLQVIKYNPDLIRLLNKLLVQSLKDLIATWFKIPELRPKNDRTRFEQYEDRLTKAETIRRLSTVDWPDGLYAYQVAQLKFKAFEDLNATASNVLIRLTNKDRNIKLHLSMEDIRKGIEQTLSNYFQTYIYAGHNKKIDAYIFIISIAERRGDPTIFEDKNYATVVYYPETEFVVTTKRLWNNRDNQKYLHDALLRTFQATELRVETVTAKTFETLREKIENKKTWGIIDRLKNNKVDASPLDIRQKRPKGFDETYVKTGEQRKRIVPINMEKMKLQYETIENNFGWDRVEGHNSLDVNLELPYDNGKESNIADTVFDDDLIDIDVKLEGKNVAKGVRHLIQSGTIDIPAPLWLEGVAISRAKKIIVNNEGVFQETDDDEGNKRQKTSG